MHATQSATHPLRTTGSPTDRARFLREHWETLARQAGGRPIALYGAGRHTRMLLNCVAGCAPSPSVSFILDDAASGRMEIQGIPVVHPTDALPSAVAMVVVSSDAFESELAERAASWAVSEEAVSTPPKVYRLYNGPKKIRPESGTSVSCSAWGNASRVQNDHLPLSPEARVIRLPGRTTATTGRYALPPAELRAGYSPYDDSAYLESGRRDVFAMRRLIASSAPDVPPPKRILDWGCSTGRMIRHWDDVACGGGDVWGCDICAASIAWASEQFAPVLRFFNSTTRPHLPLPDASMDLIYGNSVFTHIRELWDAWLMELRRVVRPGGLVHTTILDETSWEQISRARSNLIRTQCYELDFSKPLTDDMVCHGTGTDIVTFWHSRGVRSRWSAYFDVLAIEPTSVRNQSAVLLQRRTSP